MTDSFARLKQKLEQLPNDIQQKVIVGATRAGATVIAKKAKELAPKKTGRLQMSIGVAKAKKKDTDINHVKFYVVPKTKMKKSMRVQIGGDSAKITTIDYAYYGHFLEFGTSKMPSHPFLRPAIMATERESVDAFKEYAEKRIEKELEKIGRR